MAPRGEDLSEAQRYADLGVNRLVVPVPALGKGNPVENIKAFADKVIGKVG